MRPTRPIRIWSKLKPKSKWSWLLKIRRSILLKSLVVWLSLRFLIVQHKRRNKMMRISSCQCSRCLKTLKKRTTQFWNKLKQKNLAQKICVMEVRPCQKDKPQSQTQEKTFMVNFVMTSTLIFLASKSKRKWAQQPTLDPGVQLHLAP